MRKINLVILAVLFLAAFGFSQGAITPIPHLQFFTNAGAVCASCTLSTFAAGTNTVLATYSDTTLGTANPTVIGLNSAGRPSVSGVEVPIYLDSTTAYKFILKTATGATIWTQDGIKGVNTLIKEDLALTTASHGAALIGYSQVSGTNRNVALVLAEFPTLKGAGAAGNGTTNDSVALTSACTANTYLIIGPGTYNIASTTSLTNCVLDFRGGIITVPVGITFTTAKKIIAPEQQIFAGVGTFVVPDLKAKWFGAATQQIVAPGALSVAIGTATGLTGSYYYQVTFVTPVGETEAGTVSTVITPSNQKVSLTNIPVSTDPSVTGRNIYRTVAAGTGLKYLVTNILNNTATTYTDSIVDGSLGVTAPLVNSTGGQYVIDGDILYYVKPNATAANQIINVNGRLAVLTCPEYADNAAAIAAGLKIGDIYRTVDALKIVH
jgi:hypothetical protein